VTNSVPRSDIKNIASLSPETNLISLVYESIEKTDLWAAVLDQILEFADCHQVLLLLTSRFSRFWTVFAASGRDADELARFCGSLLPVHPALFATYGPNVPPATLIAGVAPLFAPHPADTPEWASPDEPFDSPSAEVSVLHRNEQQLAVLLIKRQDKVNPYTKSESGFLQSLLPHMSRAFSLVVGHKRVLALSPLFVNAWHASPVANFVTNSLAHIQATNRAADELLDRAAPQHQPLTSQFGVLRASAPEIDKQMMAAITRATSFDPDSSDQFRCEIPVSTPSGPIVLCVSPCPPHSTALRHNLRDAVSSHSGGNLASITVLNPYLQSDPNTRLLMQVFALTAAEAELCSHLAAGNSLAQAATALHVSINTVRTHLRRALTKTHTKRQAQLVALSIRLMMQDAWRVPPDSPQVLSVAAATGAN
jgi:DNA-binding CsgD family transcriptional regulator